MDRDQFVRIVREAGMVERAHTLPHHGSYSVAMHGFGCASLVLALHPAPSVDLLRAALWHDVGERFTGDVPAPAKWGSTALDDALSTIERRVFKAMGLDDMLTDEDHRWLRAVDILEFYCWVNEQQNMGNGCVTEVIHKVEKYVRAHREVFPPQCMEFFDRYVWLRESDVIPGSS